MLRRLLLALACALALAPSAAAGGGLFVGAAEDAARTTDPVVAHAKMELARLAGFDAIRMTSIWSPGQARPSDHELRVLRTAGGGAQLNGIRIILSVYHKDQRTSPLTAKARAEFASYVATIAREVPGVTDFIIGNEPNLNLFWMPQYNADGSSASPTAYLQLLAETYDAVKAVSEDVNVIGGSVSPRGTDKPNGKRPTHSPTRFIPELGKAYRASGRTKPVMDAFAFHPYLIPSKLPPTFRFSPKNTTIALSDYDKLTNALKAAFDGTAQPGSTLPIVYDEFGYQSAIPPDKQGVYTNLDSPAARDAISESLQAAYYRQALAIAQCQPNVSGMLLFHVTDEFDARAWQSGVYYADDTPKTSLPAVRQAAIAAREGKLARCAGKKAKKVNPVQTVEFPKTRNFAADHRVWEATVSCDRPCKFVARLVPSEPDAVVTTLDLLTGQAGLSVEGTAPARKKTPVKFPAQPLAAGSYQFVVRLFDAGKPGTSVVRFSEPFTVKG